MSQIAEWRSVVGYEDIYEVSSDGRVRRVKPYNSVKVGRELVGFVSDGYRRVLLSNDGHHRKHFVHDLVCKAFHGLCPGERYEVAHGDGVRLNNHVDNLRWATREENKADMVIHGTRLRGEQHPMSKLTESEVAEIIRRHRSGEAKAKIAAELHISRRNVAYITNRVAWAYMEVSDD